MMMERWSTSCRRCRANRRFSVLVEAVGASKLADALSVVGSLTAVPSTNVAFFELLTLLDLSKVQRPADKLL